jgi:hypothetical protein
MSSFDIRNHVEFNNKGRAQCPCCILDGKKEANLSVMDSGAYKCHRGHTPVEIREQLGEAKDQQAPPPKVEKNTNLTERQVLENQERLKSGEHCLAWLLDRGLDAMAIDYYKLGAVRAKTKSGYLPAISIPIPDGDGRYYSKKRIAPWLDHTENKWSQYGVKSTIYVTHDAGENFAQYWLCEGEWDAIALGWAVKNDPRLSETITVVTATTGAGNVPDGFEIDRWMPHQVPIVTWFDLDKAGRDGAQKWRAKLGNRVAIGDLGRKGENFDGSGLPEGYDVSDALKSGLALDAFVSKANFAIAEIEATSDQPPTATAKKPRVNPLLSRMISNDELLDRAEDFTDWLIPDILSPNELFILAAPPRTGKGLFCMTLAKAIATGGKFLDRPATQGAVLYVNLEDSETKIKIRQISQGWERGMPVHWIDKFSLSELPDLRELAASIPDLRLIILDTFSRVRDDSHTESSSEMGRILGPVQEMARDLNVCIILAHHTPKLNAESSQGNVSPFDLIRGNGAIRGTARGAIVILPAEDSYRICTENGFAEPMDLRARINPATCEWQLLGRWNPRIEGTVRDQVLDYLNLNGQGTVKAISTDLRLHAATIGTILSKLHGEGLTTKVCGKGRSPAIYSRSFNLLQLDEALIETYNPYTVSDTALLQLKNPKGDLDAKSDQRAESDQREKNSVITFDSIDHFLPPSPFSLKQSCTPEPVSVPCFNDNFNELKQIETTCKPQLSNGARVNARRRDGSDVKNALVIKQGLPPVMSVLTSRLSPGVLIKRYREEITVAADDCEVIA